MTEDALAFENIHVDRAPGFDSGSLSVDGLSPGINVVHGPNASGKSTLGQSIQWLLWPDEAAARATLTGQLSLDSEPWRVEVDPSGTRYQLDGHDTNGPNLPPAEQRDRYHLSLHDLLQHDARNESFAQAIKRESAGGFDLSAAYDELGFDDSSSTAGISEVGAVENAVSDWRDATEDVQSLRRDRDKLSDLHSDLAKAKDAKDQVKLLEQAIEYAEARDELTDATDRLDDFPDAVSRIDGDEADTIEELESRIQNSREKKETAEKRRDEAEDELERVALPDDGVPDGFVDRVKSLRDDVESLEDDKRQCGREVASLESQRDQALDEIPLSLESEDLAALDTEVWADISEFARTAQRVRAERSLKDTVEQWLSKDDSPQTDQTTVDRGRRALENWLRNPPTETETDSEKTCRVALVSGILVAVSGGLLGTLVHPGLLLFTALGVGIVMYGVLARSGSPGEELRTSHQESFDNLELAQPDDWEQDAVRSRLVDLYDEIAAHRVAEQRKQRRESFEEDIDTLEEREEDLARKRLDLTDELGVAPDATDVEIFVTVKAIVRWQEANERLVGRRNKQEEAANQAAAMLEEIREMLEPYGADKVTGAASTTEQIRALEKRRDAHTDAQKQLPEAKETIAEAETTIADLAAEQEQIFASAGLQSDDTSRLRELCEQVDAYKDTLTEVEQAKHLAQREEDDLEAYPGYDSALKEQNVPELETEKRDVQAVADDVEELSAEITEIETKIQEAKRGTDVEDALAQKERALDSLAAELEDDYGSMVGHVLTEHVRERSRESSRPAVFNHAQEILERITKGRYRLDIVEDEDTFRAYDTIKERGFGLDELSSATQLQVLLAVRIAFVEQQEQGVQLPIVLDETLANTDDGKAAVIIESMMELARDGRQVFYFTAQGDEVAKWISILDDAEDVEYAVTDLGESTALEGQVDVPALADVAFDATAPPAFEGHDHESYGDALDVPQFNPRRGAGSAHLWYLVEDVELLHHFVNIGFEYWGQVESLLQRSNGEVLTDDSDAIAALERRGQALEEFVRSWKKGRGKPVDRQALEDSGAVSGTFIDEVSELADEYNGEGKQIIDALGNGEVDNFRRGKKDELQQYFEENGYIQPIDALAPGDIRVRVMETLVTTGVSRETASDEADHLLSCLAR